MKEKGPITMKFPSGWLFEQSDFVEAMKKDYNPKLDIDEYYMSEHDEWYLEKKGKLTPIFDASLDNQLSTSINTTNNLKAQANQELRLQRRKEQRDVENSLKMPIDQPNKK